MLVGSANQWVIGENSAAIGSLNWFNADNAVVFGVNNAVSADSGGTVGRGLINDQDYQFVVGTYNDETPATGESPRVFTVGNGNEGGEENRRNALIVFKDGSIWMERQGDILWASSTTDPAARIARDLV